MELRAYFDLGLSLSAYEALLTEAQRKLHELHKRRAAVDAVDLEAVRASSVKRVLVITEPWCGDSLAIFPAVVALFHEAGIDVRVIRRDEHPELIDRFLTHGGRAIPIVLLLDDSDRLLVRWGPRPEPAQAIVEEHREAVREGTLDRAEIHRKIRSFYGADQGKTLVAELLRDLAESDASEL